MDTFQSTRSLNRIQQFAQEPIGWVAMLWGLCIVMPVGMQYLCLFLLLILMSVGGRWRDTATLFRQEQFWFIGVCFFLGITLLILVTQEKYYPETVSNLWHGLRIVLTMIVGLSLYSHEAKKALITATASLCLMSTFVAAQHVGLTQSVPQAVLKFIPLGNEWISMSILLAMLSVASVRMAKATQHSLLLFVLFLALTILSLTMNLMVINQRTAFVALAIGLLSLAVAWWRSKLYYLLGAVTIVVISIVVLFQTVDAVHGKFNQGLLEIEQARAGVINQSSMGVRYYMYSKTTDMMSARPFKGWGIGGWNEQWKQRTDPQLHGYNMPHNDFLWMGAQAGWGGAVAWLVLMLSLCWISWKQHHAKGHVAFSLACIALVSSLVNSGTRDASIGLPMLFIVSAALAWSLKNPTKSL
jgi:O-antigen ligase